MDKKTLKTVMPAGLPVEVIAKVLSRYYRVPRYFFTVLTVAHNRWYRSAPTYQVDYSVMALPSCKAMTYLLVVYIIPEACHLSLLLLCMIILCRMQNLLVKVWTSLLHFTKFNFCRPAFRSISGNHCI